MLNWDDLRFLLALRNGGSLAAAARQLKVEPSTASRRLCSLEAALGAQLAARTPEGLVLNAAGMLASDLALTMERGVNDLLARVGGEDQRPQGVVKLAATESMAVLLMRGLVPLPGGLVPLSHATTGIPNGRSLLLPGLGIYRRLTNCAR